MTADYCGAQQGFNLQNWIAQQQQGQMNMHQGGAWQGQAHLGGLQGIQQFQGYQQQQAAPLPAPQAQKEKSMFKEIRDDVRSFMREHKSVIYWTLILYVVDHFCFNGACKARLQQMVQKLVGQVEAKVAKLDV